ncbi:hypothetical protein EUGRSUZ_C02055 [Eucalyptus grandis]|uniref:Uncharacterized protein n=2 Tax=Eucalyptus grandis TaxID=71139 RepID=A0ACC3LFN3_EUCGR|nr:hypothetical protein EUGRSUZ_C02055 [Eucalyptus grandis]
MSNIRFLRLDQANLEGNFEQRLSSLRWLHWQGCPRHLLAKNLDLTELVVLDLSWSKVSDKWNGWSEIKVENTGIVELPNTVNKLNLLRVLKIDFTFVRELPCAIWKLKSLEELHASRCRSLAGEIPTDIKELSRLRVLRLGYSRIRGLPNSISTLPNLQTLDLIHCDKLHRVPKLPPTLISLFVGSKLLNTIPEISSLVKLGELFLADGSQELVLPDQSQIEAKGDTYLELKSLSELKILQLSMLKIKLLPGGLDHLRKLTKLSLCCIHLETLPWLPLGLFTLSLCQYKSSTGLPDLSYLELLSEFELFNCAVTKVAGLGKFKSLRIFRISHCNLQQLDELKNLICLASLNVSYCQSLERLPDLSKLKKLKDIKIKGCPKIRDIKSVEHLRSFKKPRGAIIEAESSFEVEFSKPANTKHSSIQGVKCKDKEAKSSDSVKSITEGASSDLQNSPPVADSSTTWHRVKAVASKFSCQMIFRTKPTHSFPH